MNGISVRRIKLPVLCEVVRLMGRLQKEVAMLRRKERLQKMKESSKSRRSPSFSQLPAAQREYFTYFQHASCNIVVVTLNGSILEANRCFCKSMKRSPDELIGSSLFSFIHPSYICRDDRSSERNGILRKTVFRFWRLHTYNSGSSRYRLSSDSDCTCSKQIAVILAQMEEMIGD